MIRGGSLLLDFIQDLLSGLAVVLTIQIRSKIIVCGNRQGVLYYRLAVFYFGLLVVLLLIITVSSADFTLVGLCRSCHPGN